MCVCVVEPGVRFPDDSADDVQKQKQLLKDAAAFLVSCQIPSLVSDADTPADPGHVEAEFFWSCFLSLKPYIYVCVCFYEQVKDCLDHSALPMDGATLTEALRQRGINVRYLGTVLEFVDKTPAKAQLEHFYVSLNLGVQPTLSHTFCPGVFSF